MGKISQVYYKEVPSEEYNVMDMGQYYFYHNMIGINDKIDRQYEEYEHNNRKERSKQLQKARSDGDISVTQLSNVIFDISSLKSKVILIVEL